MALRIDEEVQGYLDRGWFPVTEDNRWTVNLTELQMRVYTKLLSYWKSTGSRYLSEEMFENMMREAGYEVFGGAKKSLAGKAIAMPYEIALGYPIIRISGVPYRMPGDSHDLSRTPWPCETDALSRAVSIWCMPEDVNPIVLESDVADLFTGLLSKFSETGNPYLDISRLKGDILTQLYCSDERAVENMYQRLKGIGLFRSFDSERDVIHVRPYKVGEGGEVFTPRACQKVPKPEQAPVEPVIENDDTLPPEADLDNESEPIPDDRGPFDDSAEIDQDMVEDELDEWELEDEDDPFDITRVADGELLEELRQRLNQCRHRIDTELQKIAIERPGDLYEILNTTSYHRLREELRRLAKEREEIEKSIKQVQVMIDQLNARFPNPGE